MFGACAEVWREELNVYQMPSEGLGLAKCTASMPRKILSVLELLPWALKLRIAFMRGIKQCGDTLCNGRLLVRGL